MSTASDRLQLYLDAEAAVLKGQSVQLGERRVQLADLAEIRKAITLLRREVAAENAAAAGKTGRFAVADFRSCE
jgi:hypothetical protein